MRTIGIPVKITMPIPYDKPDRNGVIYTKDAVRNAVNNLSKGMPIVFRDNGDYDARVIGATSTTKEPVVIWDDANQICQVLIDGSLMAGGTECVVNKIDNGTVLDFEITGLGVSMITSEEKEDKL